MAILIPDVPLNCTGSERQVFNRLARELDDDWVVLHSLGLARHERKLWGEVDFVILSTKGIFVLEVKGGDVACRDGMWHFGKPGSSGYYLKREGPFKQAKDGMFAVKMRIEQEEDFRDLLVGYGVVMPHASFEATGAEIEPEVLLDSSSYARPLGFYVGKLSRYWAATYSERHGGERKLPTVEQIRLIRQLLRPDIDVTLKLGSYLNGLEQDLIQLTNQQVRAARGMNNNPRTIVSGRAGTGKTVIAIDRAERLARSGEKVLYLCFNQLLARHVALSLGDRPEAASIKVRHLHGLMREAIAGAGLDARLQAAGLSDHELFGRIFPEVFIDAALAVHIEEVDVLVVDEAQDLLTVANLDALDLLVRGGLKMGHWHLFLDPQQNIYGKESESATAMLEEAGFASYELYDNCRNTREVAIQTSLISGLEMALEGAISGVPCDCIYYRNTDEFVRLIDAEVRGLLKGGLNPRDMVVLSTRRRENSLLAGVRSLGGVELQNLAEDDVDDRAIGFSTMHAFKGLERKVVLAVDLDRIGDERNSMLHYAGLSRAIVLLRPFIGEPDHAAYDQQARAFGARLSRN